jgi:hypothetical protein
MMSSYYFYSPSSMILNLLVALAMLSLVESRIMIVDDHELTGCSITQKSYFFDLIHLMREDK